MRGAIRVPGSKSIAQRALLAAALARGETHLSGLPGGEDVRAARAWAARLAAVDEWAPSGTGEAVRISGTGADAGRWRAAHDPFNGMESGTLARCGTAVLALCGSPGHEYRVEASGSLRTRGHPALWEALGERVVARAWPTVVRAAPPGPVIELRNPTSSQEVSALLLALAAHRGQRRLRVTGAIPSRPYVDLTRAVLEHFGARVTRVSVPQGEQFEVEGPLVAAALEVEPDASLAALPLVAACLSGGEVTARSLARDSWQGDVRLAQHLRAFGCRADWSSSGLVASGRPTRGVDLDLAGEPDLAPPLAVLAADAATRGHASELCGLQTLPGKESARIEVLAAGLGACGWRVLGTASSLSFAPGAPHDRAVTLDPRGDHRMAFAFALAGLCRPGVSVAEPDCVSKSWPGFWDDLAGLLRGP